MSRHLVVKVGRVEAGERTDRRLGEGPFDLQHGLGVRGGGGGVCVSQQLEGLTDMFHIQGALPGGLGTTLEVVVGPGQSKAALIDRGDHCGGVFVVLLAVEAEEEDVARGLQVSDLHAERLSRTHTGYPIQLGFQRQSALSLDPLLVHAGSVVVTAFLLSRTATGVGNGSLLQDLPQQEEIALVDFHELGPEPPVSGQGVAPDPSAAGILVEVFAGINAPVHAIRVERMESGRLGRRLSPGGKRFRLRRCQNPEQQPASHGQELHVTPSSMDTHMDT